MTDYQPYDDRPNYTAKTGDLRPSLISEFLYTVKSDLYESSLERPVEEIAESMHLIGGPSEMRKPLNAGLMFFNERPDSFFPYARIEVVDKPDPTGVGMTEQIFHIFFLVRQAWIREPRLLFITQKSSSHEKKSPGLDTGH